MIVAFAVKLARFFDHARNDIIPGEAAPMALGPEKTKEIAKSAA